MSSGIVLVAILWSLFAAGIALLVLRPKPAVAPLLRPHLAAGAARLGAMSLQDTSPVTVSDSLRNSAIWRLWGPMLTQTAVAIRRRRSREATEELMLKLRRVRSPLSVDEFRMRLVGLGVFGGVLGACFAALVWQSALAVVAAGLLGVYIGAAYSGYRVTRDLEDRERRELAETGRFVQAVSSRLRKSDGLVPALRAVCREKPGVLSEAFSQVLASLSANENMQRAFMNAGTNLIVSDSVREIFRAMAGHEENLSQHQLADILDRQIETISENRLSDIENSETKGRMWAYIPMLGILMIASMLLLLPLTDVL